MGTHEARNDNEGPLELPDEDADESVAEGEGLPEHDEHHDEDEAGDDHLNGLGGRMRTRK